MRDYLFLPDQFHRQHDVCMSLIGQIEEFIIDAKYDNLKSYSIELSGNHLSKNEHIFNFLLRTGKQDDHDKIVKGTVVRALLMDICYFSQEAFTCSLKKRLSVTFALIRKPFVFSLIVILRILFEEKFIEKFNSDLEFDPAKVTNDERNQLIDLSLKCLTTPVYTVEDINRLIFDKIDPGSLINMSDRALHLSTTRNENNLTGVQNFNFIFSIDKDIQTQWKWIYSRMPALLLYLVQLTDVLVFNTIKTEKSFLTDRLVARAKIFKKNKR
ncbi:MAG TPA: hypothetical protein VKI61_17240 [Chitinophagaceae bacterium]|jgi:hypothetical protein|nr:hypothetical protein [Chitinophagaceae bacterium]